jgi:hypothetical protein
MVALSTLQLQLKMTDLILAAKSSDLTAFRSLFSQGADVELETR